MNNQTNKCSQCNNNTSVNNIFLSIIVPIYNASKYLSFTLDSIVSQTFRDFELILINDGSTDNCEDICKRYVNKDNRISYYYKENGGLSSARNYGIVKAKGKWLSFIDSDDYIMPDFYETLINSSLDGDYDFIVSTFRNIKRNKLLSEGPSAAFNIGGIHDISARNFEDCKQSWTKFDSIPGVLGMVWKKLYRRDIIEKNHLSFTTIQSEDELFDVQYCCHINSFRSLKYAGYCYIDMPGSMCKLHKNIAEHDWIELIWQSYETIKDRFDITDESYWDQIYLRMLARYSAYILKGYYKDTRISYFKRIKRWKEIKNDPYFQKMTWKHTWIPTSKACYLLSKFKLYYIGDLLLLFLVRKH